MSSLDMSSPTLTYCTVSSGDDSRAYFGRALSSIVEQGTLGPRELRLGFSRAPLSLHHALGFLCGDCAAPQWCQLAEGMERFRFTGRNEERVYLWNSTKGSSRESLMRYLFHDVPLTSEYVVWLDDDTVLEPGWRSAIAPWFDQRPDYIGQPRWHSYTASQTHRIQTSPWYMGVPFDHRDRRAGVSYMAGGFVTLRAERIREANFPDLSAFDHGEKSARCESDVLLGEVARQLGWTRADHWANVKINADPEGVQRATRRPWE